MNFMAWMQEVRRLCSALSYHPEVPDRGDITLTHGEVPKNHAKTGKGPLVWQARCSQAHIENADTSEEAMRLLVFNLRGQLADRIAKKREELLQLERVQGAQLKLATSDDRENGAA